MVAIDYGMKWNILRCLVQIGCQVTVVPGTASAEEVLCHKPDGIFLSNGPGDPEAVDYGVEHDPRPGRQEADLRHLPGSSTARAGPGWSTFKLKFGHRGANQPVRNEAREAVEITTQNHGFAVDAKTLPACMKPTHINLNDGTLEGMRHREHAGLQRAVPSGSIGRPARQLVFVRGISEADGLKHRVEATTSAVRRRPVG